MATTGIENTRVALRLMILSRRYKTMARDNNKMNMRTMLTVKTKVFDSADARCRTK